VVFDIETCSTLDLRKAGAQRYALDCIPLCIAWRMPRDNGIQTWRTGEPPPAELVEWVRSGGAMHAWNIAFDAAVWAAQLVPLGFPPLPMAQAHCIMARALYWGLPASLDQAGKALGLVQQKSMQGHALMMRMARPRAEGPPPVWWHETEPDRLRLLVDYCAQDVATEAEAHEAIPDLPPTERRIWLLDQTINTRGVMLDLDLVNKMHRATGAAARLLDQRVTELTRGVVTKLSQRAQLLAWLQAHGYVPDDLRRATVLAHLPQATGPEAEGLRLRLDSARTSTAKLASFQAVADPTDGRARGLIQYYGAGRTGRWAGRLCQPHNLPRPTIKRVDLAVDQLAAETPAAGIELFHEDSALGVIASCLRGCFVPRPGHLLVVSDLAQIEARVIAWLAGQTDILRVFASGQDVYTYTAAKVGSQSRQFGKVLTLACGFQMSGPKFRTTAATYGLDMTEDAADSAVAAWREANPDIVKTWYAYGKAADLTVMGQGKFSRTSHRVHFEYWRGHMLITLPSGRQLVYRDVRMEHDPGWGRDSVVYSGVDQRTRQWGPVRSYGGKIAENVTQAVARDILAEALLAVEAAGLSAPVLSVHDEIISEARADMAPAALAFQLRALRTAPRWAAGLPVGAEGSIMPRYGK
jgi:DNA polymerase